MAIAHTHWLPLTHFPLLLALILVLALVLALVPMLTHRDPFPLVAVWT